MAAIFTRNKYLGWASLVFALQNWLGESEGSASAGSSTPGYFSVGMSGKKKKEREGSSLSPLNCPFTKASLAIIKYLKRPKDLG